MIHLLRILGFLAATTGVPLSFWIRLPAILADAGSLVLVALLVEPRSNRKLAALLLMAACPVSLMISGFHGNTDPVVVLFLLLSIFFVEKRASMLLAGVALGMAVNVKAWPIVLLPVMILYLPNAAKRTLYCSAAGATVALGSMPYLLQEPYAITTHVLGYKSTYGQWGLSRLVVVLGQLAASFRWLEQAYYAAGRLVVVGAILIASFWMNRGPKKPPLFFQCGLATFLLMTLTPGFAVQYLAWLVPWVVGMGLSATLLLYVTSGVFLFLFYSFWCPGFPWYLADTYRVEDLTRIRHLFELLCWASVLVVLCRYLRDISWITTTGERERERVHPLPMEGS